MEELLSPQELAAFIGVPVKTIFKWNSTGTGPRRIKVGRHVRYRKCDVEAWLEQQAAPAR